MQAGNMDRWLGKTAVVTGAASGMGEAITRALLQNGVNVAALEVQKERLAKLDAECKRENFRGKLFTIHCDVTCEDEVNAAFSKIEALGGVDIMVNNAGVAEFALVLESDKKIFERLFNINVIAVAECTKRAVRLMRKRNVEGHIFNINSVISHYLPFNTRSNLRLNLYPASKHASHVLTHSVRQELADMKAKIRITSICPGSVKTNLLKNSEALKDFYDVVPSIHPKDIADMLIYALGTRPEVQITDLIIQPTGEIP